MAKLATYGYSASAVLAGTGLLLCGRRPRVGAALFATGLLGAGLTASMRNNALGHDGSPGGYAPTDTLKPLADRVWVVDSGPLHGVLPLRMTVIQLPDGSLLLHSPTQFTPELQARLSALGPIRALVAPNLVHWMFLRDWQRANPEAETWAVPRLRQRKQVSEAGIVIDHDLSGTPPACWGDAIELTTVPGGFGFSEVALFHKPSRTLVLTDLVLNLEPERLPVLMRPLARLLGVTTPIGRAPIYVRAVFQMGGWAARTAALRLVRLRPDHVVFAHGRLFEGNPAEALSHSLSWLLPE